MYLSKIEVEKSGKTVSIFTPQRDQFQNRPTTLSKAMKILAFLFGIFLAQISPILSVVSTSVLTIFSLTQKRSTKDFDWLMNWANEIAGKP